MNPYDIEAIVLGSILRYGTTAMQVVPTELMPEKFIFDLSGQFGSDHAHIFEAIQQTVQAHREPILVEVSQTLKGLFFTELRSLVDRLEQRYKIYSFDPTNFAHWVEQVDLQGVVFLLAHQALELSTAIEDPAAFNAVTSRIKDVDQWSSKQLSNFSSIASVSSTGYQHVAKINKTVQQEWEDLYAGKVTKLVDTDFPILMRNKLFPKGKMTIIHGMSGSGKSSFVFQMCLGAAIKLYLSGEKGCIAINSLEMEQEDLVEKLASILSGVDVTKFLDQSITREEVDRLQKWSRFVDVLPIYVDDTNFMTTSAMEYRSRGLHVSEKGPVIMLATDYGELFKDDADSEEQRVNKIFREQFRLSRAIKAAVVAISQSTVDRAVSGKTYIAGPDAIRYSKGALQAADVVGELWNPEQIQASGRYIDVPPEISTAHPWLFIQKYRKGKVGTPIPMGWIAPSTAFFDLDVNFGATPGNEIIFPHLQEAYDKFVNGITW